jgi:hypothetical protein
MPITEADVQQLALLLDRGRDERMSRVPLNLGGGPG